MLLLLILVLLIAYVIYTLLKPEIKPTENSVEYAPATTEGSSPVYRRENVDEFPTTLPNPLNPEEPIGTLYELFEYAAKAHKDVNCLGVRPTVKIHTDEVVVDGVSRSFTFPELGAYEWKTYSQVHEEAIACGAGFVNVGMNPGDFLAIFEDTCYEWTLTGRAAFSQSLTIFTVYANLGVDALEYALNQGEIRFIVANNSLITTLISIKSKVPSLEYIFSNGTPKEDVVQQAESVGLHVITIDELIKLGRENPVPAAPPSPEDLALIMYTSGSTGVPKGVVTTHQNIVSAIAGIQGVIIAYPGDRLLHYLPLAHSMANMLESFAFYVGCSMGFGSPRTLSATGVRNCNGDLKELSPHLFVAVPTIFEKVKHAVVQLVNEKGAVSKFLFNLALKEKLRAMKTGSSGALWDKLVFNKTRERLGVENFRIMVTGSAPLSGEMQDFSRALFGAPLLQGYGLTETCSSGTVQVMTDFSNNKIGIPTGSTEIKLVDVPDMEYLTTDPQPRGEIWIRGPTITQGYFKDPQKIAEVFIEDEDNPSQYKWFATGDIGQWCEEGVLQIIDRKKNLIKASHGEYIALEKLEAAYRNCSWLDTLVVYVDGHHYHCIVLGVPNRPRLTAWARANGLDDSDFGTLIQEPAVNELILKDLQAIGRAKNMRSIEMIRAVCLQSEEWTPQNNMLTAAMKLNRTYIVKALSKQIEVTYKKIE